MAQRSSTLERAASFKRQERDRHRLDADGARSVDTCRICSRNNAQAHSKYTTMCTECGRLYARYMKTGTKDSLTAGKKLLSRCAAKIPMETQDLMHRIRKQLQEVNKMEVTKKKCKQCGRTLSIEAYRRYTPRGRGIYDTTTGYHTVCKECENFNQTVNSAYSRPESERTPYQQELLVKAKTVYEKLHSSGLEPKGRYAKDILNIHKETTHSTDIYISAMLGESTDSVVDEFKQLLEIELTEEPDVYNDMLDELEERCAGPDGRVKSEYKDIYMQVLERFNDYEDNYQW